MVTKIVDNTTIAMKITFYKRIYCITAWIYSNMKILSRHSIFHILLFNF